MNHEPYMPLRPEEEEAPPTVALPHEEMRILSMELKINDALPNLVQHESTALLLDVNNFYRQALTEGFTIDYLRLRDIFAKRCDLRYCGAFSAIDRKDPSSVHWEEMMISKGYTLVTKDLLRYTVINKDLPRDHEDHTVVVTKGNLDVDITIEAMDLNPAFGHVIIGSCDGDFVSLIRRLKKDHHRKVSVLGIGNKQMAGLSKALVESADNFYNIMDLKEQVLHPVRKP